MNASPIALPRSALAPLSEASETYLDLARVFATNVVVLGHIILLNKFADSSVWGPIGVVTFFLLSGYLIFRAAWKRFNAPTPGFASFMVDRVARIFVPFIPALALAVAVNAMLPVANYGEPGVNTGPVAFLGNLTLMVDYPAFQALHQFIDSSAFRIRPYNTAEPFWTIPIEFWIYTLFGLWMFVLVGRERVNPVLVFALFAISAPVVLWNSLAGGGECLSMIWAAGALFAWGTSMRRFGPRALAIAGAAAAFGLLGIATRLMQHIFNPYEFQTVVFVACVLFGVLVVLQAAPPLPRFIARMVAFFARYSYSLYLVHNTVLIAVMTLLAHNAGIDPMAGAVIGFAAAHLTALAFYLLFERYHRVVGAEIKRRLAAHRHPPYAGRPAH